MLIIVSVFSFLFSVLAAYQVLNLLTRRQQLVTGRLKSTLNYRVNTQLAHGKSVHVRRTNRWLDLGPLAGSRLGRRYVDKVKVNVLKAGIPLKPEKFAGINILSGLAMALFGFLLFEQIALIVIIAAFGLIGPWLWLRVLRKKRALRLESQLFNAIVLMNNSLRAGYSFMQALELVGSEMLPPLSSEFNRIVLETKMGTPLEEALSNLVQRVDSQDLEMMVTAVLIQRQVGGNLAEVLASVAATIDKRIKTRARLKALTAQARLSTWIVSLLPFGLGAFVFGAYPEFGRIMLTEPLGLMMLGFGAVLLVFGVLIIRQVADIEL